MPEQVGVATVSLKYKNKEGKERGKPRIIGKLMQHSDGSQYIEVDGFFAWEKFLKTVNHKFFITLACPRNREREPGEEG